MQVLEKLKSSESSEQRRELAHHVVNLFFAAEREGLEQHQHEQFGEIFVSLLHDLDLGQQVRLSAHMAHDDTASHALVNKMARSAHEVAAPVLEHSTVLTDDDLVSIAKDMTTEHRLAMSRRDGIGERVTDTLISFGERPVLHSVTENVTAQISERGFMALAEHSLNDEELMGRLSARMDMPVECAQKILPKLDGEARAKLAALVAEKSEALDALVLKAKSEEARHKLSVRQQRLEAKNLAKAVESGEKSIDDVVITLALTKRPHSVATVLAECSLLPEQKCFNAIIESKGELLPLLCKAINVGFAAYFQVDKMRREFLRLPPGDEAALKSRYEAVDGEAARKTLRMVNVIFNVS